MATGSHEVRDVLPKTCFAEKRNGVQKYWARHWGLWDGLLGRVGCAMVCHGVPWCFCIYCYATAQVGRLVTQRLCSMGKFQVNGAGARALDTRQRFRHCNSSFVKVLRDKEKARAWAKLSNDVSAEETVHDQISASADSLAICRISSAANFTGWTCDRTCTTLSTLNKTRRL